MQPVRGPDPLGQQLRAVVAKQLQITRQRVDPDRRQLLLARGDAGDRERVAPVALPLPSEPRSLPVGQRAAHVDDLLALLEQEAGDPATDPARALDPEPPLPRRLRCDPGMQRRVGARVVAELARGELPAELVDQTDSKRALVRIDPDRDHQDPPSAWEYDQAETARKHP